MHYVVELNYVNLGESDELVGWYRHRYLAQDKVDEHNEFNSRFDDYDDHNYTVAEVVECYCHDPNKQHNM